MANDLIIRLSLEASDYVRGARQAKGATDDLTKDAQRAQGRFDQLGFSVGGVAKALGGAFLAKQAFNVGRELAMMAASADEAASKFTTVFGPAVADMNQFLDGFARMSGLARHEAEDLSGTLGNIVQGLGASQGEASAFSQEILELAGDLASFNDRTTREATEALTAALTGERERLKGFGIVIGEAEVQARALQNTGKAAADELTRMERAAATLELSMERAGAAVGDNARTAGSAARQYKTMEAAIADAQVQIGRALLPIMSDLVPVIADAAEVTADLVSWLIRLGEIAGLGISPPQWVLDLIDIGLGRRGDTNALADSFAPGGFANIIPDTPAALEPGRVLPDLFAAVTREVEGLRQRGLAGISNELRAVRDETELWNREFGTTDDQLATIEAERLRAINQAIEDMAGLVQGFNNDELAHMASVLGTTAGTLRGILDDFGKLDGANIDVTTTVRRVTRDDVERFLSGGPGRSSDIFAGDFDTGGFVPGPIGRPALAIVHGGEEIVPHGRQIATQPTTVNVTVNNPQTGDLAGDLQTGLILSGVTELVDLHRTAL